MKKIIIGVITTLMVFRKIKKRKKKHIKDKNYYGFLNELDKNDKRIRKLKKQYKKRGFDDSETWSLDLTIAQFILPRLKRYKEITIGCPASVSFEEWDEILDKMIKSFEIIIKEEGWPNKEQEKIQEEGLDLFRKYFLGLWW